MNVRVFIFVLCANLMLSQNAILNWAKSMGGSISVGRSVATDAMGNVYVGGYFSGTIDFDPGPGIYNLTSVAMEDLFICKLSPAGTLLWVKQAGGMFEDFLYSICLDNNGNVTATGYFQGVVDFDPGPNSFNLTQTGAYNAFLWKLDGNGNFIWAKSILSMGTGGSQGISLKSDASDNIYLTGFFNGTSDFDPGTATYTVSSNAFNIFDIYILKLNSSGNFMWVKTVMGNAHKYGRSISLDNSNNILITGEFFGTADFDPGPAVYTLSSTSLVETDIFILKLNQNGDFIWANCLNGTGVDLGNSITSDQMNNIYIAGAFIDTLDFDPGPSNYTVSTTSPFQDIYVAKFGSSGDFIWVRTAGTYSADAAHQIEIDNSGVLNITGFFTNGTDFDPGPAQFQLFDNTISSKGFIWKLDVNGNFVWADNIMGFPYDIGFDNFGNTYSTGSFAGTLDFDPGPGTYYMSNVGGADLFVLKFGNCVSITATTYTVQNVTCSSSTNGSVSIIGSNGFPTNYMWYPMSINSNTLTGLSAGIYTCIITNSCLSGYEQTVSIIPIYPDPSISITAGNSIVCPGKSVSLVANGANTYTWYPGSTTGYSVNVTPVSMSIYTVNGSSSFGCVSSKTIQVDVYPNPVVNVFATPSLICAGQQAILSAAGANSFTWLPGGLINASIIVSPLITSTYSVEAYSINGCLTSNTIQVIVTNCTNINESLDDSIDIKIYPNPVADVLRLERSHQKGEKFVVFLRDSQGKLLKEVVWIDECLDFSVSEFSESLYVLEIFSNGKRISMCKVLKKQE